MHNQTQAKRLSKAYSYSAVSGCHEEFDAIVGLNSKANTGVGLTQHELEIYNVSGSAAAKKQTGIPMSELEQKVRRAESIYGLVVLDKGTLIDRLLVRLSRKRF